MRPPFLWEVLMGILDIEKTLNEMTLEEKASLCSGADFWHTKAVERLGLPAAALSDGPHGLRKQEEASDHLGAAESIEAVCFPTASAMACSFDRELINKVGRALGEECLAEGVDVLLGPGINMKRSPLCGRNFEYYSEDPYLAGELGAAFVNGIQSMGVGASLKHFAANNQEWRRMSIDVEIDERTLREIYLAAFEKTVKKAKPWTVMCSYNKINGVYSCENGFLLNETLRDEWGYEGLVMTDWGAMNDRVEAIKAGLDLEMPSSHGENDKLIVKAVKNGSLSEKTLNSAARRTLKLVDMCASSAKTDAYDKEAHHALAKEAAINSAVLLKNDGALPLSRNQKLAFIGKFAKTPRIQGGGSSHINCYKTESALDAVKKLYAMLTNCEVTYAQGYVTENDETDDDLMSEAVAAAAAADTAVIFAGLPDSFESEGYDRTHLDMPRNQNLLIEEILKVQPNVVVVLHNGAPVSMPWLDKVNAVLEMYLAGQASGAAAVDLLFGNANPSGKLAETFPLRLEDNPSFINFPGSRKTVRYGEGVFIGYRYYDKKKMDVLFPFGHGLSYTSFKYSNLKMEVNGELYNIGGEIKARDSDEFKVYVDVENVGAVAGFETVQLYVKNFIGLENRPEKELKNFEKIYLEPGETKTICMTLDYRSFAYYSVAAGGWLAESGLYSVLVGASSRDIRLSCGVFIKSTKNIPFHVDETTTCRDVELFAKDSSPLDAVLAKSGLAQNIDAAGGNSLGENTSETLKEIYAETPIHSILSFSKESLTREDVSDAIEKLNKA